MTSISSFFPPTRLGREPNWSEEELVILRSVYPINGARAVAEQTGRHMPAIYTKANALGLMRTGFGPRKQRRLNSEARAWSPAELELVACRYVTDGAHALAKELDRTPSAICMKACALGVTGRVRQLQPIGFVKEISNGTKEPRHRVVRVAQTGVRNVDWKRVEVEEWEKANGPIPDGFVLVIPYRRDEPPRLTRRGDIKVLAADGDSEDRELRALKTRFTRKMNSLEKAAGLNKHQRNWCDSEVAQLLVLSRTLSAAEIAAHLGRTKRAVHNKCRKLGLQLKKLDWSESDLQTLTALYGTHTNAELAALIGRSRFAVDHQASRLGLTGTKVSRAR